MATYSGEVAHCHLLQTICCLANLSHRIFKLVDFLIWCDIIYLCFSLDIDYFCFNICYFVVCIPYYL